MTFAFALRGAGDTRFVTWLTFILAWPIMVLPTIYVVTNRVSPAPRRANAKVTLIASAKE